MLIKKRDNHGADVLTLQRLLDSNVTSKQRFLIEREIKCLGSGVRGEESSAYYMDFRYKDNDNWAVIHDLRLEHNGFVAQIDHLLINRILDVYVLESKNYYYGIKITPEGEFLAWNGRTYIGIESPIEQNKRHIHLLEKVVNLPGILPTRLGISLSPAFHSYVMVAPNSRIDRPSKAKFDTSMVIKADALVEAIGKRVDSVSVVDTLASMTKLISRETLEALARSIMARHKPSKINYADKFGVKVVEPPAPKEHPEVPASPAFPSASNAKKESACEGCGNSVDAKVVFFCRVNKEKFGGKTFCRTCQQALVTVPVAGSKSAESNRGASATDNAAEKKGTCGKCGAAVDGKVVFFCRINKEKFEGKILCRSCQKTP
jgi:hypothetical protein